MCIAHYRMMTQNPLLIMKKGESKMPYIKPELRPPYKEIFEKYGINGEIEQLVTDLHIQLDCETEQDKAGCLQYILVYLFKNLYNLRTREILDAIIEWEFFTGGNIHYQDYEHAAGCLYRLAHELNRRGWMTREKSIDISTVFKQLDRFTDRYEDKAIQRNGDI